MEQDLDDELQAHLEVETARHLRAGLSPDEARRRAIHELGGIEQTREACREVRGVSTAESVIRDLHLATRVFRRESGFSAVIVTTLALGIGATTAVFGVVKAVLITPLPFAAVDRIVLPWRLPPQGIDVGMSQLPWGRTDFLEFAGQTKAFEHVAAFLHGTVNLTAGEDAARLEGTKVSAGFFAALGIEPQLGRVFRADDDRPGSPGVVILSDRVWRERFAADPGIVGRALKLNGESHEVIGVMPPGFTFPFAAGMPDGFAYPGETELWVPLALSTAPPVRGEPSELAVVGRLRTGISYDGAQAELDMFARQLERRNPRAAGWFNTRVTPLTEQVAGAMRRPLWLLFAAVGVVLLVTCANIANLLLTRSVRKGAELALRSALGAGRGRLIQQLLAESVLLATAGGVLGVAVAYACVAVVKTLGPASVPRLLDTVVDPAVLAAAALITLASGLIFGIAPAMVAVREQPASSVPTAIGGTGGGRQGARLRNGLLVAEVALAVVLVAASALLATTFAHLIREDGGFTADRVLTFELTLPLARYPDRDRMVAYYQRVIDALHEVTAVEDAGLGETIPLDGNGESTGLRLPDLKLAEGELPPYANYTVVSPGYFAALGTPIRKGRSFLSTDGADSVPVVIVNEAFARTYWPDHDPIGKRVGVPIESHDMIVVGVAADVKHVTLRDKVSPEVYVPFTQKPWPSMQTMHFAVRTRAEPTAMAGSIRAALRQIDPEVPLARVMSLSTIVAASLAQSRFAMVLVGGFGALTLLLAALGLYGTVAYTVAARTAEIGIRVALGASRTKILRIAVGACVRLTLIGIVAGAGLSFAVLGVMSRFLYGVQPNDPTTLASVALALLVVSAVACMIPARRALRVDPVEAIRTA